MVQFSSFAGVYPFGCPSIRAKALSSVRFSQAAREHRFLLVSSVVEDQKAPRSLLAASLLPTFCKSVRTRRLCVAWADELKHLSPNTAAAGNQSGQKSFVLVEEKLGILRTTDPASCGIYQRHSRRDIPLMLG